MAMDYGGISCPQLLTQSQEKKVYVKPYQRNVTSKHTIEQKVDISYYSI